MNKKKRLEIGVWVLVLLGMFTWFLAESDDFVGKNPVDDEVVIYTHEKDLRTGQFFDVQVIKCRICGQVTSWVRFDHKGKVLSGYFHPGHDCNKVFGRKRNYDGAEVIKPFNLMTFLERLQRRMSRR